MLPPTSNIAELISLTPLEKLSVDSRIASAISFLIQNLFLYFNRCRLLSKISKVSIFRLKMNLIFKAAILFTCFVTLFNQSLGSFTVHVEIVCGNCKR